MKHEEEKQYTEVESIESNGEEYKQEEKAEVTWSDEIKTEIINGLTDKEKEKIFKPTECVIDKELTAILLLWIKRSIYIKDKSKHS